VARVKRGVTTRARHKKVLKFAQGQWGNRHRVYRRAHEAMLKALYYADRDRHDRKRDFRRLWITRINAASRQKGLPYNQFMAGLKRAGVDLDRKVLADMAVQDPTAFAELVGVARDALAG